MNDFLADMNADVRSLPRLWVGVVLVAAVLAAALLADRAVGGPGISDSSLSAARSSPSAVTSPASGESVPVMLRVGGVVVTATLDDTPAAREFAAMMPLRLDLHDPMGQAKSGRLPRPINAAGADRIFDPSVGGIYYWPPSSDIGIFHTDLGQSLPPPGLVRLGAVSGGLDEIAAAGNRFTVWVDRADRIGTWSNDRADQP